MEETAQALEVQLFYDAFNASPIGIAVENLEGQPLFANPALCSMLGLSEAEMRSKHCSDFSPPEDAAKDRALFEQLRDGLIDHYQLEKRFYRRDGSLFWGRLSLSLLNHRLSPLVVAMVEDITEKKRAQEDLALVTSEMAVAVSHVSRETQYLWANERYAQWLKRPLSEIIGARIVDVVGAEAFEALRPHVERVLAGENVHYEQEMNLKGIGKKWVAATYTPMADADGRADGFVAVVLDITERKRVEDSIRESEVRYRGIVETTNEGVWMLDANLHNSYVNGQMAEMLGYEPAEMVGRSVFDFYSPEDIEHKAQVLANRRHGRREQFEERLKRKDGTELWVRVAATPLYKEDGEFDGALAMMSDVTEHRRAQEAMRESEERFRLVSNTAPVMIWMSGVDRNPTYFNQLWMDFTGLSETAIRDDLRAIVHPDDFALCHETYCRGFDQRQPFRKECRLRRHDGEYRWMLDIGVPRFHQDGSFAGYIGSCIDVTDQKTAEQMQRSMTRKLVEAQEQERARIARELHDDINQRLVMLSVELEGLQESPSEMQSQVQRLRTEICALSRDVHAISHDLHSTYLEYLGVIAGMKSWCKDFAERRKMEIDCINDVQSTVPAEIGLCLFRVLQEALHNVFMHSGVRRSEVVFREELGEIHLIVSDSGRGFDMSAERQGKGLGLTSMRERVRLVSGTIRIDSTPDGGTSIHARVPLQPPSAFQD